MTKKHTILIISEPVPKMVADLFNVPEIHIAPIVCVNKDEEFKKEIEMLETAISESFRVPIHMLRGYSNNCTSQPEVSNKVIENQKKKLRKFNRKLKSICQKHGIPVKRKH